MDHYPDTAPRAVYLTIVVLATVVLYYELYIPAAVGPAIIRHFDMGFSFFVYVSVIGNAVGAFASLFAGLADRWGRANLVTNGLLIVGLLMWVALPHASSVDEYTAIFAAVSFVEGIILVATPALIRDFSPQLGRASAMGFWTLGPVVGSLIVAEVSSHTLAANGADFTQQFVYAGWGGIIVFALALVGLRELSPQLRDQLMVSRHDRALIEARASGLDIGEAIRHPWRQMLHADVVGSAFAISIFLIIYYTAVGFTVVYFTTTFGFTQQQANSLGNWMWAFNAGALVVFGVLSDLLKVRKPLMVVGALGSVALTVIFGLHATEPKTSYSEFVLLMSLLAVFLGITYAPWMASFTETVERRNPALTATGLAVWGWTLRIIVSVSLFALPLIVTAATPLVDHGPAVAAVQAQYPQQVATLSALKPATLTALQTNPTNPTTLVAAVSEIMHGEHIGQATATQRLLALSKLPAGARRTLALYGNTVARAAQQNPGQWQTWWFIAAGCEFAFLPFVFLMAGRWSPRRAREDAAEHEQLVAAELARLQVG